MNYTKTYESLVNLNEGSNQYGKPQKVPVQKCSAMLLNHLQCWRAADVLITTVTTVPAEGDIPEAVNTTKTQMCYRHAMVDQQEYQQLINDEKNAAQLEAEANIASAAVAAESAAPAVKK